MLFYLSIGALLWIFSGVRLFIENSSPLSTFATILIFWLVAAMRFETGFDWLVYEQYFEGVDPRNPFAIPTDAVAMEPLYHALNYLVRRFSDNFQWILVVAATINAICVSRWLLRAAPVAFGVAFYFCWVYLPLQMGTIRQSLAVSLVLLAMLAWSERRTLRAALWYLLGIGFQYSTLLYLPVFFGPLTRLVVRHAWPFLGILVGFYLLGIGFGGLFLQMANGLGIPFISEKVASYQVLGLASRSLGGIAYFVLNCLLFAWARLRLRPESRLDEIVFGSLILLLVTQGLFFDFPLLWNRVQYLAALPQAVLLYHLIDGQRLPSRLVSFMGVAMLSFAALAYQVSNPLFLPYIPYFSYVEYVLEWDPGTGRDRTLEFYQAFETTRHEKD